VKEEFCRLFVQSFFKGKGRNAIRPASKDYGVMIGGPNGAARGNG
jgi:hypothetical protein